MSPEERADGEAASLDGLYATSRGDASGELAPAVVVTAIVSLAMSIVFLAVAYLSYQSSQEKIVASLQVSFADGALDDWDFRDLDSKQGYNQYNDCLVFSMTLLRTDSPLWDVLAPQVIFADWLAPPDRGEHPSTQCGILRDLVSHPEIDYSASSLRYGRYLHGHRVLANLLLPVLTVDQLRALFRFFLYGLLLAVVFSAQARALMGAGRAIRRGVYEAHLLRAIAFTAIATAFMLFYGLAYFGPSISHAPSESVLFGFLLVAVFVDLLRLRATAYYAAIAAFGCAVAHFEFLTGAAPLALAALIAVLAIQFGPGVSLEHYLRRLLLGASAFTGAVILCFALHLALLALFTGESTLSPFTHQLGYRIGGDGYGLGEVSRQLALGTAYIGLGSQLFGAGMVAISLAVLGASYLMILARCRSGAVRVQATTLLASAVVVFVWYAIFRNHTYIHYDWMARLLAWPMAMGWVMAGAALIHLKSGRTATRHTENQPEAAPPT